MKFYPDANGSYAGGLNFLVQPPQIRQTWQWLTRIDHNFSSNDKIFGRIGGYNPNGDAQQRILNKANNDTSGGFRDTQITLSHTHVFGPRWSTIFASASCRSITTPSPAARLRPSSASRMYCSTSSRRSPSERWP